MWSAMGATIAVSRQPPPSASASSSYSPLSASSSYNLFEFMRFSYLSKHPTPTTH